MPCVAHLMLVMILNLPEQCSFQDLLFHLLFMPKSAEKSASRMDISLGTALIHVDASTTLKRHVDRLIGTKKA